MLQQKGARASLRPYSGPPGPDCLAHAALATRAALPAPFPSLFVATHCLHKAADPWSDQPDLARQSRRPACRQPPPLTSTPTVMFGGAGGYDGASGFAGGGFVVRWDCRGRCTRPSDACARLMC
jgi:hypothetical protein